VFSSLDQIYPMPVDLEKFCLHLFPGARWVPCTSPIEIFSDLKEKARSVEKLLKWDPLILSSKFGGNLQKLDGHRCAKTTIRRSQCRIQ
jgi:hypothetical protein